MGQNWRLSCDKVHIYGSNNKKTGSNYKVRQVFEDVKSLTITHVNTHAFRGTPRISHELEAPRPHYINKHMVKGENKVSQSDF